MTQQFKGTALITGASTGIGSIYAERLARRGYDLVLVARNRERLNDLASRLTTATRQNVEVFPADLANADDLAKVERKLREDASISLLVNNAGIGTHTSLLDSDVERMAEMITLNVTALTRLTYAAVPGFVARRQGAVINISSVVSLAPSGSMACMAAARPMSPLSAIPCTGNLPTKASGSRRYCPAPPRPTSGRSAACRSKTWTPLS